MAVYSPAQIIGLVLHYKPSTGDDHMLNALAIALAESGGNLSIISPSHDYGLWQINRIHFGDGIINSSNWQSPTVQFNEMWRLSGGMWNWAAWCTAWADPGPNCGHGNLPNIQKGSAAWGHLEVASQAIGHYRGTPAPGLAPVGKAPTPGNGKVSQAWDNMNNYIHRGAPAQWSRLNEIQKAIGKVG